MPHRSGTPPAQAPTREAEVQGPRSGRSHGRLRRSVELAEVSLEQGPDWVRLVVPAASVAVLALEVTSLANRTSDTVGIRSNGRTLLRLSRDGFETAASTPTAPWQALDAYAIDTLAPFLVQAALGFAPVDHVDLGLLSGATFTVVVRA